MSRLAAALALALVLVAGALQPALARPNVLVVFDEDNDLPGLAVISRNLRQVFRSELKDDVDVYNESLGVSQFGSPEYYETVSEHLRLKYQHRRPDLIVAVMEPALDFLLRDAGGPFPGVPIVFCGVEPSDIEGRVLGKNVTGVLVKRDFAPTLEIALRLQPQTRDVFVVAGAARFDRHLQAIARQQLQRFADRVFIRWLAALPMDDLLSKVSALPPHSVIYYLTVFADGTGRSFVPHDALARIATAANAPVYVAVDQYVGNGAVGGNVYSVATHGQQAAEIGVRILRGEPPAAIPAVALAAQSSLFDWRQLRRWHLDERLLPPGSIVEFRTPSLWEAYRWYIVAGVVLFLLQTALVIALLANRAQRRRSELARQNSEEGRRKAEEEARRQRDELAHAQRVATLGELTASIAHELNQPLTAILANAQAARLLLAKDRTDPELDEALQDMTRDASRAGETIRRLHALFKKEPGARAPVDVGALVEDALRLLAPDMRAREIAVHFVRQELPPVLGDGVQLRQVVINLLVNAEEAIALAGGGPREVRVATGPAGAAHVEIAVRDSGTGVKEAELERMFQHFVSTKPQGLGMGLAISRSIVEAHGGRIWATRNEVRGLTLHIELPAAAAANPEGTGLSASERGA